MLVAAISGVMLCGTAALLTGLLLVGLDAPRLVLGMLGGTAVAVIAYTAVFVTLSVWSGRALIVGLGYLLLWEGFIASFFSGTRLLSIREYGLAAAAGSRVPTRARSPGTWPRDRAGPGCLVTVVAFGLGARRLARFEISDAG